MMTQAGVRTVVVGGRPESGPMQAASGTRAAAMYTAVDCRIYWTLDNVVNFTRLWTDVVAATWEDPGRCVAGSTGSRSSTTDPINSPPSPPPRLYDATPPKPVVAGTDFDPSRSGLANQAYGEQQITSLYQTTLRCDLGDAATHGYDSCGKGLGLHCAPADPRDRLARAGYCVSACSSTDPTCLVADQQCRLSRTPLQPESKGLRASAARGRTTSIYPGHCRPVKTKTKKQKLGGKRG